MIFGYQDNCKRCAHYQGQRNCLAFPSGIPDGLWRGGDLHRDPVEGDRGYRFAPRPSLLDVDASAILPPNA